MNREVIRIPETNKVNQNKPIEFTHLYADDGWQEAYQWKELLEDVNAFEVVVYLGRDFYNGDIFAIYESDCIHIVKGHLHSGKY